jgi:hypothetical protein
MPGAQERWDQLTEPSVRSQEATPPDQSRLADRPERGSLGELRRRLERLPAGHPSSPYNDDLTRKLPVASLKDLELPLHGTERDLNGAAKHYEHQLAGAEYPAASAEAADASASAEASSHNGAGDPNLVADALSTPGWSSTADAADLADDPDGAEDLDTPDGLAAPADDGLSVPGDHDPPADLGRPGDHDPPADLGTPGDHDPPADLGAPGDHDLPGDLGTPADLGTANGLGATGGLGTTDEWLSAPAWSSAADADFADDWSNTRDPDDAADRDRPAEPDWAEPEPGADTLSQPVIDAGLDDPGSEPRTGPDGSWEWNGRYLTPDERLIAENALSRYRVAEGRNVFGSYGHSGLTPAMRRVEAQLASGQLLPDTEDRTLKSPDRFKERLADLILRHPDKSAEELAHEVHDSIRYAFIFDTEHYAEGTLQVHSRLKGHGFELEARWNGWESREYKGINSRWRDPAHDLVFEVQFHTASSWDAWQQAHDSYKQIIDPRTSPLERMRLRADHAEKSAVIPVPPGCTAIPDFRKESQ